MKHELSMKSDYVFGEFFSRKGNEDLLKDFLTSIMEVEIHKIEVIQQANLGKITKDNKLGVVDLKVTLNDGIVIDVEMQVDDNHNWEKRVTYYAGKLIASDLAEGEDYKKLKNIVVISILDYNLTDLPEYKTESVIVAKDHRDYELVKGLKYYFIELPKFRKQKPDMNKKLDQWLAFIDGENWGMIEMAKRTNEQIEKAVEELIKLRGDKEVVAIADARLIASLNENSAKRAAREDGLAEGLAEGRAKGRAEGRAEGRVEGRAEGRVEGRAEGLAEGRAEGRAEGLAKGRADGIKKGKIEAKKEFIKNMKKEGMEVKLISKITGISVEEINKI